jgi:hypothetical protein
LAIATTAAAAFLPPNNNALRLRCRRAFTVAAIAPTCAMSFADNLMLGVEATLDDSCI